MERKELVEALQLGGTDVTAAPGDAAAAPGGAPSAEMMSEGAPLQMSWDGGVQQAPVTGELQMSEGGGAAFGSVSTTLEGGTVSHGLSADEALRRQQETLDGGMLAPKPVEEAAAKDAPVDELSLRFGRIDLPTFEDHRSRVLAGSAPRQGFALPPSDSSASPVGMSDPIDEAEQEALVKYLNRCLEGDTHLPQLPLPPGGPAVFEAATPGVLLAKFVACVEPEALDARALNRPDGSGKLSDAKALQNHTLCNNAAVAMGCGVQGLEPEQMLNAPQHKQPVFGLVWNPIRSRTLTPTQTQPRTLTLAPTRTPAPNRTPALTPTLTPTLIPTPTRCSASYGTWQKRS